MVKNGFIYLWYDRKHKRYYLGSHLGEEDDGYVCSSTWMKSAYKRRPHDFKRRILKRMKTDRKGLLEEEHKYLSTLSSEELGTKYYNLKNNAHFTRGNSGRKHSDETKRKISEAKKKNPTKYWEGKSRDEGTKEKISKSKIGKSQEKSHREKNSKRMKELWKDPIWREKQMKARRK